MPVPRGLRVVEEAVPKLGAKAGVPPSVSDPLRSTTGPLEHLCGQLDVAPPKPARELVRVMLTTPWVDNKRLALGEQVDATRYVRRRRPAKA